MIFIAMGIIVLIISFVIALISLFREQKAAPESSSKGVAVDNREVEEVTTLNQKVSYEPTTTNFVSEEREPFPWEQEPRSLDLTLEQKDVVHEVKQSSAQDFWKNEETNREFREPKRKLVGEISLRDLLKS